MKTETLAAKLLKHTVSPQGRSPLLEHTAEEIRLTCQELISQGHEALAIAVGEAAYALHPDSEDILAITSLMAVMQGDWVLAIDRMSELVGIQGLHVQEMTYVMLTRAKRCNLDPIGALETAVAGLEHHPTSSALLDEYRVLRAFEGDGHLVAENIN